MVLDIAFGRHSLHQNSVRVANTLEKLCTSQLNYLSLHNKAKKGSLENASLCTKATPSKRLKLSDAPTCNNIAMDSIRKLHFESIYWLRTRDHSRGKCRAIYKIDVDCVVHWDLHVAHTEAPDVTVFAIFSRCDNSNDVQSERREVKLTLTP